MDAPASRPAVTHGTAYVLAATSMIIWGSPPVVARAIASDMPPLAVSFARWSIALLLLLPFVARKLSREWPRLKQHWRSLALLAAFMTAGSTLSVLAVYFTTATNAVIVNASQPAITAIFGWLIAGTRLARQQKIGIACAFLGVLIMIARADLSVLLGLEINSGDLIMLGAVTGWSIYAVQLERREHDVPPGTRLGQQRIDAGCGQVGVQERRAVALLPGTRLGGERLVVLGPVGQAAERGVVERAEHPRHVAQRR